MSDIQYTSIQSLSKVIESPQSGHAPKGLGAAVLPATQSHGLTLTVVSAHANSLTLQAQNSPQRITLARNDLQSLSPNIHLQKGDKLLLVNNKSDHATFVIEYKAQPSIKSLPAPVLQALSQHWPDIPTSTLRKALPTVLSYVTLNATSPIALNTANSILEIANKTGEPTVAMVLNAKVKHIDPTKFTLSFELNSIRSPINITLPLPLELKQQLNIGASLSITLDANASRGLITGISHKHLGAANVESLKVINQYIAAKPEIAKPLMVQLLLQDQLNTPKIGIVVPADKSNLNVLSQPVKQALISNVPSDQLNGAKLVLASSPITGLETTPNSKATSNLQLSLLAKPILVNVSHQHMGNILKIDKNGISGTADDIALSDSATKKAFNDPVKVGNSLPQQGVNEIALKSTDILRTKLINALQQMGDENKSHTSKMTTEQMLTKLQTTIARELNQTLPHSMSLSKSLPALIQQMQQMKHPNTPELNALINSVTLQSTGAEDTFSQDADQDLEPLSVQQIKQIFTSPALASIHTNPIQGVSSPSGLIGALVTMLQASLQAKLLGQQTNITTEFSRQLSALLPTVTVNKNSRPQALNPKVLQELHKADPRSSLIGEINKVLSNHSLHKLAASDISLQGQDNFYYALPNMFSSEYKDIEIVIKREQQQTDDTKNKTTQQQWQLSMKLDIGSSGEVLAKVKFLQSSVDLHLYASTQSLKDKILRYMPQLDARLKALGLQVNQQCYVGKIPDKLYKTDFQVVQAYV